MDDALYYLTKMYLKEIDKKQEKFVMTKKDLLNFCIKLIKAIERVEND